jgi:hypothetical protein
MRTFSQLSEQLDLKPFLTAYVGRLYVPRSYTAPRPLIRHFDTEHVAELVMPYVEVVTAVGAWVADRPDVAELVEVEALTEIGVDFVARPFHVYYYSLSSYDDPEECDLVDVIPPELTPMRERVSRHLDHDVSGRDELVQEIVAASLLGPSPTTIFHDPKWLVVSPSVSVEQLERWVAAA